MASKAVINPFVILLLGFMLAPLTILDKTNSWKCVSIANSDIGSIVGSTILFDAASNWGVSPAVLHA